MVALCGSVRAVVLAQAGGTAVVAEIIEKPSEQMRGDVAVQWHDLGITGSSRHTVVRCGQCRTHPANGMVRIGETGEALLHTLTQAARRAAISDAAERGPAIRNLAVESLFWLRGRQNRLKGV